jgi:hypothetical protein
LLADSPGTERESLRTSTAALNPSEHSPRSARLRGAMNGPGTPPLGGLQYVLTAKDGLKLPSIAAHVYESLVRDSHQVRDFVHDDML